MVDTPYTYGGHFATFGRYNYIVLENWNDTYVGYNCIVLKL